MRTIRLEREGEPGVSDDAVRALVEATLASLGLVDDEIDAGIQWVDAARSAELNVTHRAVDGPTDVLSFPIDERDGLPPGVPRQLGDLAICVAVVECQLADGSTMAGDATLDAALRRCVVHGTLHLLGLDHGTDADAAAMFELEQQVLDEVGSCA